MATTRSLLILLILAITGTTPYLAQDSLQEDNNCACRLKTGVVGKTFVKRDFYDDRIGFSFGINGKYPIFKTRKLSLNGAISFPSPTIWDFRGTACDMAPCPQYLLVQYFLNFQGPYIKKEFGKGTGTISIFMAMGPAMELLILRTLKEVNERRIYYFLKNKNYDFIQWFFELGIKFYKFEFGIAPQIYFYNPYGNLIKWDYHSIGAVARYFIRE